jgi:phosphatidylglycerophosphate synthase
MTSRKISREHDNPVDNVILDLVEKTNDTFYQWGATPNILTTISLVLSLIAVYLFYREYRILAALLFFIGYYFDCADGHLARSYKMISKFGDYYDHISDWFKIFVLVIVLYIKYPKKIRFYKVLVLIAGFSLLLCIHMGCQEQLYSKKNESPTLEMTTYICPDSKLIRYTRYFGGGTFNIIISLIILLF